MRPPNVFLLFLSPPPLSSSLGISPLPLAVPHIFSLLNPPIPRALPFANPLQRKRHVQTTTKYVELIIVADNREVSRGHTVSTSSPSPADFHSKGVQRSHT